MHGKTVMDMTEGVIWRQLVSFAFPLFLGNIFQQLYNTVDSIVVGNFVGADALGAVTSTVPVVNTLIGLFMGMTAGASIIISQYFGAKDEAGVRRAVHTAVVTTILMSAVISAIGYMITPTLLRFMRTPASILPEAVTYLRIYSLGLSSLMLYNMGSAILRAVGDSRHPLYFLMLSSMLNICLDLLFVIRFHAGVAGVAYATILSQLASGLVIFAMLFRSRECYSLSWREMRIDRRILRRVVMLGLPTGFQMAVTSFSNVFVLSYINRYGAASTSGWGVYGRIDSFVLMPIQSMGLAVTTFVGQNAGARKADRIRRGIWECIVVATGITCIAVAGIYLAAPYIVLLFSRDPQVLYYGVLFLRLNSVFDFLNVTNQIHAGALRGMGDARTPMIIMLGSFVVFRQIYLAVVSRLTDSIYAVAVGFPVGWLMCSICMFWHFTRSGWEKKVLGGW